MHAGFEPSGRNAPTGRFAVVPAARSPTFCGADPLWELHAGAMSADAPAPATNFKKCLRLSTLMTVASFYA
jgi:hypothetical protein